MSPEMKTCTKCGVPKPATLEFFYQHSGKRDGLRNDCRVCKSARSLAHLKAFPAQRRRNNRAYERRVRAINRVIRRRLGEQAS